MAALRVQLLGAVRQCTNRGLLYAAKWAAELAVAIDVPPTAAAAAAGHEKADDDDDDDAAFALAKVYFDLKEYDRAAHALRGCASHRAFFVAHYALYLAGEQRREEEAVDLLGESDGRAAANDSLIVLAEALAERQGKGVQLDAFALYLWGLVQLAQGNKDEARVKFARAVHAYPLLWSAWLELVSSCTDFADATKVAAMELPDHPVRPFFDALLALELHQNDLAVELYTSLVKQYPRNQHAAANLALAHYNLREYTVAAEMLQAQRKEHPFRLENIDTLSNILYVKESRPELALLAQEATKVNAYTAETCCVVGNYYSLAGQHEQAIAQFQRALRLNARFLSACTLMGHEYIELKNLPAAVAAYRRAIDVSPRDYRAWYGLGQTYEILAMPLYSLYYYRQAQILRPEDTRMLSALATAYKALNRWQDAATCFERVVALSENNDKALYELGVLYQDKITPRNHDKAAEYFTELVGLTSPDLEVSDQTLEACVFLARYHKNKRDNALAEKYATMVVGVGGRHKEDAKKLLLQIQSVLTPRRDTPPRSAATAAAADEGDSMLWS